MGSPKVLVRCDWCSGSDIYTVYHDKEWGLPLHNDEKLFELLTLEGTQAGLSWLTVLKRRQGYKEAFNNFDIEAVSKFDEATIAKLLKDPRIIRNRLKILSVVKNAQSILKIQKEYRSFDTYLWDFVGIKPIQHTYTKLSEIPSKDDVATSMSKDLRKRGFSFVGPTICYAFMQASGMVNDHLKKCFRYQQVIAK